MPFEEILIFFLVDEKSGFRRLGFLPTEIKQIFQGRFIFIKT